MATPQWVLRDREARRRRLGLPPEEPVEPEAEETSMADDVLSTLGGVAEEAFGLGRKDFGDVGEFVEGMHTLVNPYAGEKDEGGLYDVGSKIVGSLYDPNPEGVEGGPTRASIAREMGGVPVEAILAATDALGITDAGAVEKLKKEFKENPLLSVLDIIPMAKFAMAGVRGGKAAVRAGMAGGTLKEKAAGIAQEGIKEATSAFKGAGAAPQAAIDAVKRIKDAVADKTGRLTEATLGVTTGTQRAPKVARKSQREAVSGAGGFKESVKEWHNQLWNKPPPAGFGASDLADVGGITNKVKDYVFGVIPAKANDRYAKEFAQIRLKNPVNQLDFPAMKQKMYAMLERPRDEAGGYGVRFNVEVIPRKSGMRGREQTRTTLDFSDAIEGLKNNADAQQRITEIVQKIDDMDNRFGGQKLSMRTRAQRSEDFTDVGDTVGMASRKDYNLKEIKEAFDGLRTTQFTKRPGIDTPQANRFIDEIVGEVREEFGGKLKGFDEMQKKREIVFNETDKMITAFFGQDPKRLRTAFRDEGPDAVRGNRTSVEQLLSPKDTHVVNQNIVDHFEGFLKSEFDVDLDIKSAVADVRLSGDDPKGLARISGGVRGAIGGSGVALTYAGLAGAPALGAIIGSMMITSPQIVGKVMKTIGASQGVIDALVDSITKGRKALSDKGIKSSALDAMTFAEMAERNMEDADIFTQLGSQGSPQLSAEEINRRYSFIQE